jgi:hypothetical protein
MYVLCVLAREVRIVGRASGTSVPRLQPTTYHQRADGLGRLRTSAVTTAPPRDSSIAEVRRGILRQLVQRLRELRRRIVVDERRITSSTGISQVAGGGPPLTGRQSPVRRPLEPPTDQGAATSATSPRAVQPGMGYRPAELEDDSSSDTVYQWINARPLPMERPDHLEFNFHPTVTDELIQDAMDEQGNLLETVNNQLQPTVLEELLRDATASDWNETETMGARLHRMERAFSE